MGVENFSEINISVSASAVAWYGAVVATVGFLVSLYNVWRDRARVKLDYSWNNFIVGDPTKEDVEYLSVDVTNIGRRPVKITHVGAKEHGKTSTIMFKDGFYRQEEDKILTERRPRTSYLIEQNDIKHKNIWYIFVIDARGKEFRAYPTVKDRLQFWISFPKRQTKKLKTRRKK